MTAYFYCCPQRLDVGSFVDSGEGGRILRTYDHQTFSNTWIILVREVLSPVANVHQLPERSPPWRHTAPECLRRPGSLRRWERGVLESLTRFPRTLLQACRCAINARARN